jgi:uncharacterized repeat protein (TIGR02543 family)
MPETGLPILKNTSEIRFDISSPVAYGDTITLHAESSSIFPIMYRSSNNEIAKIEGNILIAKSVGNVVITAYQEAENDFDGGSYDLNITIEKAILTIRVQDEQREKGTENPAFVLLYAGFKHNENENCLEQLPQINCLAEASSPAGFYDIVLSGGSDNHYSYTLVKGVLEVIYVPSNDATLSSLTVNVGTLTPAFNASTLAYSVTVANAVSSIMISAVANHAYATVSDTGTKTLDVGPNAFNIVVTAEDSSTKTYTITVTRPSSINITGANVEVAGGSTYTGSAQIPAVTVTYNAATLIANTDYTLAYTNNTNAGIATATVTGSGDYEGTKSADFTIGKATGSFVAPSAVSATYSTGLTLAGITPPTSYVWQTPTTAVNAGDGQPFVAIYTDPSGNYNDATGNITVNVAKAIPAVSWPTKAEVNSGQTLATAVFTAGSSNGIFTFESGTTTPTMSNSEVTSYTLVFTPTDAANYNTVSKTDMKVTVIPSSDATLSSLTVSGYSFDQVFNPNTTTYTLTVLNSTQYITISATAADNKAKSVAGIGEKYVAVGETPFYITVTAEDNSTTKQYMLIVTRLSPEAPSLSSNANLASLSVSGYSISPAFSASVITYTLTVPNATSSITINAAAEDSKAKSITGTGVKSLNVGSNSYSIVVTAEDNSSKTYTITVTREATAQTPTYTITFDSQGGSIIAPQTVTEGEKATQPTAPTRTSYTFGGWDKEAACTNAWSFANETVTGNVTLYAKWTVSAATAVATAHMQPLQVYPNPVANEQLIVSNEQLKAGDKIEMYSLSGALLKIFAATGTKSAIDVSTLPVGTYVVKAGNRAAKVVKQ